MHYPYPTEEEIQQMAEDTKLDTSQVIKWFANKRKRTNNTKTTNGAMDPRTKRKKLLEKEAKENPAAAARRAADRKLHRNLHRQEAVLALKQWYNDHKEHPYPTPEEKKRLALENDLKVSQVTCWFGNSRSRSRKTSTKGSPNTEPDLLKMKDKGQNMDIKQDPDDEQNPESGQENPDDGEKLENE